MARPTAREARNSAERALLQDALPLPCTHLMPSYWQSDANGSRYVYAPMKRCGITDEWVKHLCPQVERSRNSKNGKYSKLSSTWLAEVQEDGYFSWVAQEDGYDEYTAVRRSYIAFVAPSGSVFPVGFATFDTTWCVANEGRSRRSDMSFALKPQMVWVAPRFRGKGYGLCLAQGVALVASTDVFSMDKRRLAADAPRLKLKAEVEADVYSTSGERFILDVGDEFSYQIMGDEGLLPDQLKNFKLDGKVGIYPNF